jgi:sugar lactone lactonase YvrE
LVERVESDGSLLALVGRGEPQDATTANGTLASNLQISILRGMAQDAAGNLYLADAGAGLVFRVAGDGRVSIFAGGGTRSGPQSDGGPATAAQLISPRGMVFDSKGNLDVAETVCDCIRQVEGLAIDTQDNLYLTEWLGHTVLKIAANGSVTTIAGTGVAGFSGDGGPATAAQLYGPSAVAIASDGAVYIADSGNNRVRKVALDGSISTIAGTGTTRLRQSRRLIRRRFWQRPRTKDLAGRHHCHSGWKWPTGPRGAIRWSNQLLPRESIFQRRRGPRHPRDIRPFRRQHIRCRGELIYQRRWRESHP